MIERVIAGHERNSEGRRRCHLCDFQGSRAFAQLVDLNEFRCLLEHEKARSKMVNYKPDRLVIVEYAPMHLKGYYARVPALVVAVVFTPQTMSLMGFHMPSACSMHP